MNFNMATRAVLCFSSLISIAVGSGSFFPFHPNPSDVHGPYDGSDFSIAAEAASFDWMNITPSRDLEFHFCYDAFRCARLELPLDWLADDEDLYNHTIALAVIKRPANISIQDSRYGGPILTNPGGPGGSGIRSLLGYGETLQNSFDDAPHRYYDVVSFDPRGVLLSTPNALCFPNHSARLAYLHKFLAEGALDTGDEALKKAWARSQSLGQLCAHHEDGDDEFDIRRFTSTASTARDMLALVEKLDEYNKKELASARPGGQSQEVLAEVGSANSALPQLQYYGVSYGTALGNTFASMFPDRVGRMILDAVVDIDDYMKQGYTTNLQDTELVVQSFYKYCFLAGPDSCEIYDSAGPAAIEHTINNLIENLNDNPTPLISEISGSWSAYTFTYTDLRLIQFGAVYEPLVSFPFLSKMYASMLQNNYTLALSRLLDSKIITCPSLSNSSSAEEETYPGYIVETPPNIYCADGLDMSQTTLSDFQSHLSLLQSQSPTIGASWARHRMSCMGWKIRPKWRFEGPFGGNTAHPILWVGNTADPVTPIRNAYRMAELFPGSAVLRQDSEGHGSFGNGEGNCTLGWYRRYLRFGVVPPTDGETVCEPKVRPFGVEV